MIFKRRAIHQFHAGSAYGDGVTNAMLFIRRLLRELGFTSEIYCAQVAPELQKEILPVKKYRDSPNQVLLLHHTHGHNHGFWVESLKSRLAMVYHNITPAEFFTPESPMHALSELGRSQLVQWRSHFIGAIGDSELNTRELLAAGYANAVTIPLLVDIDRLRAVEANRRLMAQMEGVFNIVYVGRIVENKCQHDLIDLFSQVRRRLNVPARLLLVGDFTSHDYQCRLVDLSNTLGLRGCVEMTGKVTDASLSAIYQRADVYVSMSEHEGFGMPLIEAMAHDVPVIAYNSSNIAATMGEGGILLAEKDHQKTAALIKVLSEEPKFRRRILLGQRRNLQRFEHETLRNALAGFLEGAGVEVKRRPQSKRRNSPEIRLEGPFDSSYSLALVNREFARALHQQGVDVALHASEGHGDYTPDPVFLAADAEVNGLWMRGQEDPAANVLLRDMYPPRVSGMRAPVNGLSNFAWEESGFPAAYVDAFNRSLTHITVLSQYVKKVLSDNGVRVPVTVSGAGADHLLGIPHQAFCGDLGPEGFRFLHVSSCFPRKGADVLLEAFGRAFTQADRVSLIIKTFPNIHNDIAVQIDAFRNRFPAAAPVILINEEISEGEVADLYQRCDALAAPSRGEGFGLPIAEAMLFGKPVITTAHGGQMDFCTGENAWLVDYHFTYAQTHMDLFNSVWAEPDADDLALKLREVHGAPKEEHQRRAAAGKQSLLTKWRWQDVAARNLQAIKSLDAGTALRDLPRVAWVTTWNVRCGVAAYARGLNFAIPHGQICVLANHVSDKIRDDEEFVVRCWHSGRGDQMEELYLQTLASGASAVVIQFNFGFFDIESFGRLITRLAGSGIAVHIFFHATADIDRPDLKLSLGSVAQTLALATRLYVHGVDDLNRLKQLGLVENVMLFPHGVSLPVQAPEASRDEKTDTSLLASFGYMLPDKGFPQLIEAFNLLRASHPGLRLLMLNAAYPGIESDMERSRCLDAIAASPHSADITFVPHYLADTDVQARLREADLIVFAYQHSSESSSAAVRFGLASGQPVACTPLPIFQDVAGVTFPLPGITPVEIAMGIAALLEDKHRLQAMRDRQTTWLAQHDWQVLSTRLWNIIRSTAEE